MNRLTSSLLLLGILTVGGTAMAQAKDYSMSKHYDGQRFRNEGNIGQKKFSDFMRVLWERDKKTWPTWVENEFHAKPSPRVVGPEIRLTMINHATVLIQTDGFNFITDPIWSERCSPVSFAGPKRHRPPGVAFEEMPQIDAVLISHNHYDHLDLPSLRLLEERDAPIFLAGLGTKEFLVDEGMKNVVELDWWEKHAVNSETFLHFVPAQHWSKRNFFGQNEMLWGGFVIETPQGKTFFAGDTGYGPHFKEITSRLGPLNAALLPIGAYKPQWFMTNFHMGPADAIKAYYDLGSPSSIAIHHGTFPLGQEGIHDASNDLEILKKEAGAALENFKILGNGAVLTVKLKQEAPIEKALPVENALKVVNE